MISHSIISKRSQGSLDHAFEVAKHAHEGQVRKYTGESYIAHPIAVAELVASVTEDSCAIEAAFLHDVLEDTALTIEDLAKEGFCVFTLRYVQEMTQFSVPSDGSRIVRKNLDLRYLARASSQAHTIKLADLLDNSESIIKYGKGFAVVYMEEMRKLLEVLTKGSPELYREARARVRVWHSSKL